MKNLFLVLVCILFILKSEAQFDKGQKMISGQFSLNSNRAQLNSAPDPSIASNVFSSFSFSRFTSPTTIQGFGVNLFLIDNSINIYNRNAGLFYSYMKLEKLAERFYLNFEGLAEISYNFTKNGTSEQWGIFSNTSIGLGLLYQLNNRFLLSTSLVNLASLSYSINHQKNSLGAVNTNLKTNTLSFSTGLSRFNLDNITLGLTYLLKKK